MAERRPSTKRPGITMTGRQWRTVEALEADGWLVLSPRPELWTDAQKERLTALLTGPAPEPTPTPLCVWCHQPKHNGLCNRDDLPDKVTPEWMAETGRIKAGDL